MTVIGGCRKCILTFPDERSLLRHIRLHCPDLFYLTSDCDSTSPLNASFKDARFGVILSDSNRLTPFADETSMSANDGAENIVKTEAPDDLEFSRDSETVFNDQLLVTGGDDDCNREGYLGVSSIIIKTDPQFFMHQENCSDGPGSPSPFPGVDNNPPPDHESPTDQRGQIGSECGSGGRGGVVLAETNDAPGSPAPPSMVTASCERTTGFTCYECGAHFQSAERYDRHLALHLKRNGAKKDINYELDSCDDSVTSTSSGFLWKKFTVSPDSSGAVDENVDSEHLGRTTSSLGEYFGESPVVLAAPSTSAYIGGDGCRPRQKRSAAAASDKPKLLPSCRTSNPYLEDLLDSALQPKSSTNPALGRYHNKQRMLGGSGKSKNGEYEKGFQFERPKKSGFSRFPRIVDDCSIEGPSVLNEKRGAGDVDVTSIAPVLARSPLELIFQPDGADKVPNRKSKQAKLAKLADGDSSTDRPEAAEIDSPPMPVFGGDRMNEFDQIDQCRAQVKVEIVDHEPAFGDDDDSSDQIFTSGSIFDSFNAHSGMHNSIMNQIIQNSTEIFGTTFPAAPVSNELFSTGIDGSVVDKSTTSSFDAFMRGFSSYFPTENAPQSSTSLGNDRAPSLATATGMSRLTPDAVTAFLSSLYGGSLPPFNQFPPKTVGSQQLSSKKCSSNNCDVSPGHSDMLGRIPINSQKPPITSQHSSISTSPPLMFDVTSANSRDDATTAVVAPIEATRLLSGSTAGSCLRTSSTQNEYLENIFRNNVYPHPRTRRRTVNGEQMQG